MKFNLGGGGQSVTILCAHGVHENFRATLTLLKFKGRSWLLKVLLLPRVEKQ